MICFKCTKELTNVFADSQFEDFRQPDGGLVFKTRGNYGSRVYDPAASAPELVIWICDECATDHHTLVQVRATDLGGPSIRWSDWNPDTNPNMKTDG